MAVFKVSLFCMDNGLWGWMAGSFNEREGPEKEGGGCDTPEQALKEALWAFDYASVRNPPKGNA